MLYALMLAERICKTSNRREVISHINRTTDILLALIELHCKIEYQLTNLIFIVSTQILFEKYISGAKRIIIRWLSITYSN